MKWHKVEDYPVGSDEYVLVSRYYPRKSCFCLVAKLKGDDVKVWTDGVNYTEALPTDRWCHIELPED
jgi:hypothetical protein